VSVASVRISTNIVRSFWAKRSPALLFTLSLRRGKRTVRSYFVFSRIFHGRSIIGRIWIVFDHSNISGFLYNGPTRFSFITTACSAPGRTYYVDCTRRSCLVTFLDSKNLRRNKISFFFLYAKPHQPFVATYCESRTRCPQSGRKYKSDSGIVPNRKETT